MKHSHLKQITAYLQNFKKIFSATRIGDNILKIVFDRDDEIYFDMKRGDSKIYKAKNIARSKLYNAPFDVVLAKKVNSANIKNIYMLNDDKILRFELSCRSSYKEELIFLQFEFTGKHTNIILLDANEIVLEALRHIDISSSFREVRVGSELKALLKADFVPKEYKLDDVESFLHRVYEDEQNAKLQTLKKQKTLILDAKLNSLQKHLDELEDERLLLDEAKKFAFYGELFLSHMHNIKPYQKSVKVPNYEGAWVNIEFEKEFSSTSAMSEYLFAKSKKLKQKAQNIHIQKSSLTDKISHLKLYANALNEAKNISEVELLFPTIKAQDKKQSKNDSVEIFYIEGYKVSVGKNESGNIYLLQNAKAKDIWLHLKDRPSTHVIISTDKQTLPPKVLQSAAKLCVSFSTTQKDRFLVDYTPRREVSIQSGANVLYTNYKTMEVDNRDGNRTD